MKRIREKKRKVAKEKGTTTEEERVCQLFGDLVGFKGL
jgi:hypothetical protein